MRNLFDVANEAGYHDSLHLVSVREAWKNYVIDDTIWEIVPYSDSILAHDFLCWSAKCRLIHMTWNAGPTSSNSFVRRRRKR